MKVISGLLNLELPKLGSGNIYAYNYKIPCRRSIRSLISQTGAQKILNQQCGYNSQSISSEIPNPVALTARSIVTSVCSSQLQTTPGPYKMCENIFTSLRQVLGKLSSPAVRDAAEVKSILQMSKERGIVHEENGTYEPNVLECLKKDPTVPFIVVEGLDGCGKTFMTSFLHEYYDMALMQTPPRPFKEVRKYFDLQAEPVKRAFYSLGNYFCADEVLASSKPVIMDRFWHSTAAYAVANEIKEKGSRFESSVLQWPTDLLQPNLVIFLLVSEAERIRRHSTRQDFTNTAEEQTLAKDSAFRQNVMNFYRSIEGPPFVEINADGSKEEVKKLVLDCINDRFSDFANRSVSSGMPGIKSVTQKL